MTQQFPGMVGWRSPSSGRMAAGPWAIAVALGMMLPPGTALAQPAALTDDAQTSAAASGNNFGAGQTLRVRGAIDRAFLKFALASQLPPGTAGSHVGQATLQLFVSAINVPGPVSVFDVTAPWSESDDHPRDGAAHWAGHRHRLHRSRPGGKWVTLDVTPWVQARIDDVAPNDGFVVFAPAGADVTFDSKENRGTSHEPRLEIVLTHAATADSATLAQTATNATQLGGVPAASFVQAGDPALTAPRPPAPGSPAYIQSQVAAAQAASFRISGSGTAGGTLSGNVVNATTQFNLGGDRVIGGTPSRFNLFVGSGAGAANNPSGSTAGTRNTFVGVSAGRNNTNGTVNTFFGFGAGQLTTVGSSNAFFGGGAGQQNAAGAANTFLGTQAGQNNANGSNNTFVGASAGMNSTGSNNAFFGIAAGGGSGGSLNSFLGANTGVINAGSLNTFVGGDAGRNNMAGARNTFLGSRAGMANRTGNSNTLIGGDANVGADNLSFATAIGAGAVVSSSNRIVLGRTAVPTSSRCRARSPSRAGSTSAARRCCASRGRTSPWGRASTSAAGPECLRALPSA